MAYVFDIQDDWPYFVKIILSKTQQAWYIMQFVDDSWPNRQEFQAVTSCLTQNQDALAYLKSNLADFLCPSYEEKKSNPDSTLQKLKTGVSPDSTKQAFFVETGQGTIREIMVCDTNFKLPNHYIDPSYTNYRTKTVNEEWPPNTKIVKFTIVPVAPVPYLTSQPTRILSSRPVASQPPSVLRPQPPSSPKPTQGPQVGNFNPRPPMQPRNLNKFEIRLNGRSIQVVNGDIVDVAVKDHVQAVVNAANSNSFTTGDGGISGALRDAMYPKEVYKRCMQIKNNKIPQQDVVSTLQRIQIAKEHSPFQVCGVSKYLTSDVNKKSAKIISETQAAWQQTTGYLRESGVQYVIHAVGPDWTNYENFSDCVSRIRTTIENTMTLAKNLTVDSIVFPVISGGIFCHSEKTLRDRERNTAQEILIQVIVEHVKNMDEKCELKNILIVEIDKVMCDLIKVKLKTLVESQSDTQTQRMRQALFNV